MQIEGYRIVQLAILLKIQDLLAIFRLNNFNFELNGFLWLDKKYVNKCINSCCYLGERATKINLGNPFISQQFETHMNIMFIPKWSTRIDLQNEIFILHISMEIQLKINWSRCWKAIYISAILKHKSVLFISVRSTRIDLHNETSILKVGEEIHIKRTHL